MKTLLFTLIITFSTFVVGQDSIRTKSGSSTIKKNKIITVELNKEKNLKADTVSLDVVKNEELIIPIASNVPTKIILVKEKGDFDFLKYILPVITLLLGIWIKHLLDNKSNSQKINKSGERWIAELRSLDEPIKKQIESLEEFLVEHEKREFKPPRLVFYSSLNGEVFKSLDKNDLIKYIEKNNKKEDFKKIVEYSNKTHGYISALEHLHESLEGKFNEFRSGTSNHTTSLSKNLQAFNKAFGEYGIAIENETQNSMKDERYKPIYDLYSKFIFPHLEDGDFNPFQLEKDFFIPIIKILTNFRFDETTRPLSLATTSCLNDIKGLLMEQTYMSENIHSLIIQYQKLGDILDNTIMDIKRQ